ncbi:hypothetical protein TNCV_4829241 [Trichonephila clavipes]|nr:hypothetical protein TNCV_4829241 [Trichonephila clavipes]
MSEKSTITIAEARCWPCFYFNGCQREAHQAHPAEEFLKCKDIRQMYWLVTSPPSPWDTLERDITTRKPSLKTIQGLKTELLNEWD